MRDTLFRPLLLACVPAAGALCVLVASGEGGLPLVRAACLGALVFAALLGAYMAAPNWLGGWRHAWWCGGAIVLLILAPLPFGAGTSSLLPHLGVLVALGVLAAGLGRFLRLLGGGPALAAGVAAIAVGVAMCAVWWAEPVVRWFPDLSASAGVAACWQWDPQLVFSYAVFDHDRLHDADVYTVVEAASSALPRPEVAGLILRFGLLGLALAVGALGLGLLRRVRSRHALA